MYIPAPKPPYYHAYYSTHSKRGWTFQEILLSRRLLVICDDQAFFYCRGGKQYSDGCLFDNSESQSFNDELEIFMKILTMPSPRVATPIRVVQNLFKRRSTLFTNEEMISDFFNIIDRYSRRKLTYETDVLPAISGVLALISDSHGWNFLAGFPAHLLHLSFLWHPSRGGLLIRNSAFPSWSWAGWTGATSWWLFNCFCADKTTKYLARKFQVDERHHEQSVANPAAPSPGIRFRSVTAPFAALIVRPQAKDAVYKEISRHIELWTEEVSCFELEDLRCGFLYDWWKRHERCPWKASSDISGGEDVLCEYELVALSVCNWNFRFIGLQKMLSSSQVRKLQNYVFCDDERLLASRMKFVHVVLIKWQGEWAERVTTGFICEPVWKKIAGKEKDIVLY